MSADQQPRIHLSPPHMTDRERRALLDAFDSNWIAPVGPALNEFEARLRLVSGCEAALAVNSGTSALHLAMLTLGIGPGDIVIVPTLTFVASANSVRYVGAIPHFVDCDPKTGNLDPAKLVEALTTLDDAGHPAAAVMTVDLYGTCADYDAIIPICRDHGVPIIEDAAEAIGATHSGAPAGSFGTVAAFSFNGNKMVTTGGGGALVGSADLIDRARHLASQARLPVLHFEHDELGFAYRMPNLAAAIGLAQLERLPAMVERTREIHRTYIESLSHLPGIELLRHDLCGRGNGWLSVMITTPGLHPSPSTICEELQRHNIEARPAWKPMHLQPLYREFSVTGGDAAREHFATGVCLPSGSSLSEGEQQRVIDALIEVLGPPRSPAPQIDLSPRVDLTSERSQEPLGNPLSSG